MAHLKSSVLFKELFGFRDYKLDCVNFGEDGVTTYLRKTRKTCDCPQCGRKRVRFDTEYERRIRDLDIGSKKCFIIFRERKIDCRCGFRGIEKLDFVDRYSHHTKRFEDYVSILCKLMCLKDVAEVACIDWKTAKQIDKKYLQQLVVGLESIHPDKIGVDEVSYQKGHKYLTVVRDLSMGKVIWVGEGRQKETLDPFFRELGEPKCSKIQIVVSDMWDPYIASVKEHTNADIVFDKFHIAKKITEALDSVRRREFAKADPEARKQMKKKRFLMLTRKKRLDDKKQETLKNLMDENEQLYRAYLLKEQGLDIFDEEDKNTALCRLDMWFKNVAEAGFKEFESVVKTIKSYTYGIVNYFKHRLTNAASEGFNTKINIIKRRAYGFHDLEYFKLKILQSCGWRS